MCFIKSSCLGSRSLYNDEGKVHNVPFSPILTNDCLSSETSIGNCNSMTSFSHLQGNDHYLLANLMASVFQNSEMLLKLENYVQAAEQKLQQADALMEEQEKEEVVQQSQTDNKGRLAKQTTIRKLFGQKQYKYKLKLRNKFPSTIYKERNIALSLELLDLEDKPVMNSNLVNLCVAASQVNGDWIPQNEKGEYFIQGKTETDLYHGEAQFLKIYPRDVSRQFLNGKLSIVIYPKPSLIQFASYSSSVEQRVLAEEIEPLLIKDITIRAKKKAIN